MPQKKEYLDIEEAQRELGKSRPTIYRLMASGLLRRFKRPGDSKIYIPAEDVAKAKEFQPEQ